MMGTEESDDCNEQRCLFVSEIKPCLHPVEPVYPWGGWEECPPGEHVKGMQLQIESDQGKDGDDSALNTIILTCTDGTKLTSTKGHWGGLGDYVEIDDPDNNRIVGVWMRGEADCGCCDDTAANGVRFQDLNKKMYRPGDYHLFLI